MRNLFSIVIFSVFCAAPLRAVIVPIDQNPDSLRIKGLFLYSQQDYEGSVDALQNYLAMYPEGRGSIDARIYLAKGLNVLGDGHMGLREALNAYRASEQAGDTLRMVQSLIVMGNSNLSILQWDASMANYERALDLLGEKGDPLLIAGVITNQAVILKGQGKADSSLSYHRRALELRREYGDTSGIAASLNNIGGYYVAREEYRNALQYHLESLRYKEALDDRWGLANVSINIALDYYYLDSLDKALDFVNRGTSIAENRRIMPLKLNGYEIRTLILRKMRRYREALDDYDRLVAVRDSIFDESKARQVSELQVKFDSETKEKENELLRTQKALDRSQIGKQRLILLISILSLFLLAGFVLALIFRNRVNRSIYEKDRELHRKDEALLNTELQYRERELSAKALIMMEKNQLLRELMSDVQKLAEEYGIREMQLKKMFGKIESHLGDDEWNEFQTWYDKTSDEFLKRLKEKFPELSSGEVKLVALIRLNFSTKEIADLMKKTPSAVEKARYRLRKKLGIPQDMSMSTFLYDLI